jgi:Protein of unknown function (DUF3304)
MTIATTANTTQKRNSFSIQEKIIMTTQTPNPFPNDGARTLTARETMQRVNARNCLLFGALLLLSFLLTACKPVTMDVSMEAVNHTDKNIVSVVINGKGGIMAAPAYGQGNGGCCVRLPKEWRPGLTAKIDWQLGGHWLINENGNEVIEDGRKVLVEGPWKSQTVPVPEYKGEGYFYVFFFPDDQVKVAVTYNVDLYGDASQKSNKTE